MKKPTSFTFGDNWQAFLKGFDQSRVKIAEDSLTEFLQVEDLRGRTFLDLGCGSGLFSYAAFNLGAERILSFDVDPGSVQCCRFLREKAGSPALWDVCQGSILDDRFVADLGQFDIVYAWGVLHHTGRMWDAVAKAAGLVMPGGCYYLALYNKILSRSGTPSWIHGFWIGVKKAYNAYPLLGTFVLEPMAMAAYLAMIAAQGKNPITHVANYKDTTRGMSWKTDATDWLGGWPYEFASVEEVFKFVTSRYPDFNLVNIKVTSGRGLNWYLFRRQAM